MRLKSPESRAFHGIIETAPESACNTRRGLTLQIDFTDWRATAMVPNTCSIDDCESAKYCRGWCTKHYARWRSHGDPLTVITQTKTPCTVESCDLNQHANGYCQAHLYRFSKYGDPLVDGPGRGVGRNRLDVPTYTGMHKRLFYDKGKASAHRCVDCGARAHEWSYDGGCPNELHEVLAKLPIAYSTDQARYSPRCRPCHRGRDESLNRARGTDGKFTAAKAYHGTPGVMITITQGEE